LWTVIVSGAGVVMGAKYREVGIGADDSQQCPRRKRLNPPTLRLSRALASVRPGLHP
jgi:hypothetical protein